MDTNEEKSKLLPQLCVAVLSTVEEEKVISPQNVMYQTLTMPPPPPVYLIRAVQQEEIHTPRCLDTTINRTVGTCGFFGGVFMYFGMCCCLCSNSKQRHIRDTYNGHTLCGLICPAP
jgi:hypothetical protein